MFYSAVSLTLVREQRCTRIIYYFYYYNYYYNNNSSGLQFLMINICFPQPKQRSINTQQYYAYGQHHARALAGFSQTQLHSVLTTGT